ncbi:MAG: sel1 repeat family protein [Planctomycetes bacterium]|nr:sel1 repeat family protein [Planctomycetota bacterium]
MSPRGHWLRLEEFLTERLCGLHPRYKIGVILAASALLSASTLLWFSRATKTPDLWQAETYLDAGQPAQGMAVLQQLAAAGDTEAQTRLADLLRTRGEFSAALPYLLQAAEAGDTASQALAGKWLLAGTAGEADPARAAKWLTLAAAAGEAEATGLLGAAYLTGNGVARDPERAINLLLTAAESGDAGALGYLGQIFYDGDILPRDYRKAEEYLLQSDNRSFPDRNRLLGLLYYKGLGSGPNLAKAAALLLSLESAEDPETCAVIGLMHYFGEVAPKNDRKAERFLLTAAEGGRIETYGPLGTLYYEGIDGIANYPAAFRYLTLAEQHGDESACATLGWLHYRGLGTDRDVPTAVQYFTRACQNGRNGEIHALLGRIYCRGEDGVAQDYHKALPHLQLAAADNRTEATILLAEMYSYGRGVRRDPTEAERLLAGAVAEEVPAALSLLGRLRIHEDAGETARRDAIALLRKASDLGDAEAGRVLAEYEYQQREQAAARNRQDTLRSAARQTVTPVPAPAPPPTPRIRLYDTIYYGMDVENMYAAFAASKAIPGRPYRYRNSNRVWMNQYEEFSTAGAEPDRHVTVHFRNRMLRYVSQTILEETTLPAFMQTARSYADDRYLLAGVYSSQRGLLYDVFREAYTRHRQNRRQGYARHYRETREDALAAFEATIRAGLPGGFDQVHLLFVRFDNLGEGTAIPQDIRDAYALLEPDAIEIAPGLTARRQVVTYYSPAILPLYEVERTRLWGDLFFGMDVTGARESLQAMLTVPHLDFAELRGYPDPEMKAYLARVGNAAIRLLFHDGALFYVEFFALSGRHPEPELPRRYQNSGVFFPYALHTRENGLEYDVFAAGSPVRERLQADPEAPAFELADLARSYLQECVRRSRKEFDIMEARLPEDYRFVDKATGKAPEDAKRFHDSLAKDIVKRAIWRKDESSPAYVSYSTEHVFLP